MIRTSALLALLRFAPLLAALLCTAPEIAAQGDSSDFTFTHRFGGEDGGPGYLIVFDRRGGCVRSVELLDHDAPRIRGDEEPTPYRIVEEERVRPSDTSDDYGFYGWLLLREDAAPSPQFGGVTGGLDTAVWKVVEAVQGRLVRFELDGGAGTIIEKAFAYDGGGRRDLRIEIVVRAAADADVRHVGADFRFELGGIGLAAPRTDYVLNQNPAMAVGSTVTPDGDALLEIQRADGKPNLETVLLARSASGSTIEFAGNTNRFFGAFLYPVDDNAARGLYQVDMVEVPAIEQGNTPKLSVPVARYGLTVRVPAPGDESRAVYRLFLGPKSFRVFDELPEEYQRFDPVLEKALDPLCFCSIPGSQTMAVFLLWLLGILHDVVGNWGFAIVCLTVIVRGSLVPLNFRMQRSMRAYGQKMAKLKPKLDALQTKYKNDPQQLRLKMVEFQRANKMVPPIGGCLPLFVTIPVFLGLFTALRISYELRQQPFFGWVDDLSRPDQLFELGLGFMPWFNLLPIIMVLMWLWLQSGTPLPTDPQQRQMMKIMRFMPLMMGVFLYNYASALMVYMVTSSAFGLVEQRVTRRILGPVDPNAAGMGATPMI